MLSDSDNCFPNSWEMSSLGLHIRAHRVDGGNGMAHRQAGDLHVTAAATFGKGVAKRTSGVSATNSVAFFRLCPPQGLPNPSMGGLDRAAHSDRLVVRCSAVQDGPLPSAGL